MEKAFDFLSVHREVAFATIDKNSPKIRAFQIMKQEGNTLYFATTVHKEVYRQLKANPYVELLAMEGNISVRLSGTVYFDVVDEICREIYETNPVLSRLYASYTDLVYFRLFVVHLDYFDLTFTPPLIEHKEYERQE